MKHALKPMQYRLAVICEKLSIYMLRRQRGAGGAQVLPGDGQSVPRHQHHGLPGENVSQVRNALSTLILNCIRHGFYIRWLLISRCARMIGFDDSFDATKCLQQIEIPDLRVCT